MSNDKWTTLQMPDQSGKLAIVTGATSGLGYQAALALAGAGASVVLAARNAEKADHAMASIRENHAGAELAFHRLDTASLTSVREFAAKWRGAGRAINILLLNAGITSVPRREETEDGFERQFATNYLGHFALTGLLLPSIAQEPGSRIVEVASLAHRRAQLRFNDLQSVRSYRPVRAYGQSKLAMLVFALELERRLKAAGSPIASIPVHPGVASTEITRRGDRASAFQKWMGSLIFGVLGQSPAEGALPLIFAATSPDARRGTYYGPNGLGEFRGHPAIARIAPSALDREAGRTLWSLSEQLTGVTYDF